MSNCRAMRSSEPACTNTKDDERIQGVAMSGKRMHSNAIRRTRTHSDAIREVIRGNQRTHLTKDEHDVEKEGGRDSREGAVRDGKSRVGEIT